MDWHLQKHVESINVVSSFYQDAKTCPTFPEYMIFNVIL